MDDPRYPIGRFVAPGPLDAAQQAELIRQVEQVPQHLREAVAGLTPEQLDHPYREGGWTVRQVVHHLADSHMNAFIRFKLALTEDQPTIKAYHEALWAKLPDSLLDPEVSLTLLAAVHQRWVVLLRALSLADLERTFFHPEFNRLYRLDETLALYAWHGRHHIAHITSLRQRQGW